MAPARRRGWKGGGGGVDLAIRLIFNGLSEGSILLLIAVGLAFTFGLMGVINMAHGEFIMVGAYVTYVLQQTLRGHPSFVLLLGLPVGALVGGGLGWLLEWTLVRFLYGRPLDTLLATWGVSLLLQQAARSIFGAPNVEVRGPAWLAGTWRPLDGIVLPQARLFILAVAALVLLVLYLYLYRSGAGRRARAAMQNREMAGCLGISTRRLDGQIFAIGSGLASLAGVVLTLVGPIGPSIGQHYIVDAFMVVVLGGVGQLSGTVLGAGVFGGAKTTLQFLTSSSIGTVLAFALIILLLQWRPSGLAATRGRQLDG